MKTKEQFIGIDVSKGTLDICVLAEKSISYEIKNNKQSILNFFNQHSRETTHICIENTGKYGWLLMQLIPELACKFYVVNPLHMKKSFGLIRGKSDKIDAIRIAQFIKKNHQETAVYIVQREGLTTLQVLLSERKFRVEQKKRLLIKNKENSVLPNIRLAKKLTSNNNRLLQEMGQQIKEIEQEIKELIKQDTKLERLDKQMQSIPGVGNILSWNLLVKTNEFKTITTPRKLACYSGVAPFNVASGTSIFGKSRVSLFADKSLKTLLHMGAISSIRLNNDLSAYYKRKVESGKNKMSVLNAVRNKIIHIIFALVKNQSFYQNRLLLS